MPVIDASKSRDLIQAILSAIGTPPEMERLTGDSLANANMAGHCSHGVPRPLHSVEFARAGHFQLAARARVEHRHGATAVLDGSGAQSAMLLATDVAIELARAWIGGNGFDRVLLLGEPEMLACVEHSTTGIPIPTSTWAELLALASDLGLEVTQWHRDSDRDLTEAPGFAVSPRSRRKRHE